MISLGSIGLIVIAAAWGYQLYSSKHGNKEIHPYLSLGVGIGTGLMVLGSLSWGYFSVETLLYLLVAASAILVYLTTTGRLKL